MVVKMKIGNLLLGNASASTFTISSAKRKGKAVLKETLILKKRKLLLRDEEIDNEDSDYRDIDAYTEEKKKEKEEGIGQGKGEGTK